MQKSIFSSTYHMVALEIQRRITASKTRKHNIAPGYRSPAIDFLNVNPGSLAPIPASRHPGQGCPLQESLYPVLTCRRSAFTVPTACAVVQWGCTARLQKIPGLGAAFAPWRYRGSISHCLALPGEGQGKVPGAPHVHDEIFLSYLQSASKLTG